MGVSCSVLRHIIRNFLLQPTTLFSIAEIFVNFSLFFSSYQFISRLTFNISILFIFSIKTHFYVQIWMHDFQGTPLQVACRYGADQLVHCLLDAGAWLETDEVPVYDSNSPFYLASAYGHYGVIEKLFVYQPSMCNTSAPLGEKELKLLACWCHIWNYNPLNSIKRREEKNINGLAFCMHLYC